MSGKCVGNWNTQSGFEPSPLAGGIDLQEIELPVRKDEINGAKLQAEPSRQRYALLHNDRRKIELGELCVGLCEPPIPTNPLSLHHYRNAPSEIPNDCHSKIELRVDSLLKNHGSGPDVVHADLCWPKQVRVTESFRPPFPDEH